MRIARKIAIAAPLISAVVRAELNVNILGRTAPASSPSPTSLILSDTIYERYLRSAQDSAPGLFPSVTDPAGRWSSLPADSWTSGFYSGVLYMLHERQSLCPSASPAAKNTDWLSLARRWRRVSGSGLCVRFINGRIMKCEPTTIGNSQ